MAKSIFIYVTYIRTTPETLWSALTEAEIMKQWWFGVHCESQWTAGSAWKLVYPDGRITDTGEIAEVERLRRLVIRWQHQYRPELKAEGESRCTMELAAAELATRLSLTHAIEREHSKLIETLSNVWPMALCNLKSLLESGATVLRDPFPT